METIFGFFDLLTDHYKKALIGENGIAVKVAEVLAGKDGMLFAGAIMAIVMLIAIIQYMTEGDIISMLTGIVKQWLIAGAALLTLANWATFVNAGDAIDKYLSGIILGGKPQDVIINSAEKMNKAFKADLDALNKELTPKK